MKENDKTNLQETGEEILLLTDLEREPISDKDVIYLVDIVRDDSFEVEKIKIEQESVLQESKTVSKQPESIKKEPEPVSEKQEPIPPEPVHQETETVAQDHDLISQITKEAVIKETATDESKPEVESEVESGGESIEQPSKTVIIEGSESVKAVEAIDQNKLEESVEKAISKMVADKIDTLIIDAIEKAVNKEIEKLKEMFFEQEKTEKI